MFGVTAETCFKRCNFYSEVIWETVSVSSLCFFSCSFAAAWWVAVLCCANIQTKHTDVFSEASVYVLVNLATASQGIHIFPGEWWLPGRSLTGFQACVAGALAIDFTLTASNHPHLVREYIFFPSDRWLQGNLQLVSNPM